MELVKTYRISELIVANPYDVRMYKIQLESMDDALDFGELVMSDETCKRHAIVPSLELVGRHLQCTFRSRQLSYVPQGIHHGVYTERVGRDDMRLHKIIREEVWSPDYYPAPTYDQMKQKIRY